MTFSFITATLYVLDIKRHNISSILYGGIEKFCPLRTYFTPRVMFFLLRYWTFLDKNYLIFLVKIFKSTYHKKCCIKTWYSSKSDSKCFNTSRSKIWPGGILYSQREKGFNTPILYTTDTHFYIFSLNIGSILFSSSSYMHQAHHLLGCHAIGINSLLNLFLCSLRISKSPQGRQHGFESGGVGVGQIYERNKYHN